MLHSPPRPRGLRFARRARHLAGALLLAVGAALPATAETEPIRATDLLQLKVLEAPALSPDGKWVAYVVRSIEPKPDDASDWVTRTQLWLAATDGSTSPRQLTHSGDNTAPAWSPRGDRLAFIRQVEKEKPQVWILPIDGGEPWALTKLETGAADPRWSPHGERLLFTSRLSFGQVRAALEKAGKPSTPPWASERPERPLNDTANFGAKPFAKLSAEEKSALPAADPDGDLGARREWLARNEGDANPRVTSRLNFLGETDLAPLESFPQVYVVDAREGAEPQSVALGFLGGSGFAWMRDGRTFVCVGSRNPRMHPDRERYRSIYAIDVETGDARALLARPGENYSNPTPSPDGKLIAFTVTRGDPVTTFDQGVVAIMPATGGEPRFLPDFDRTPQKLVWNAKINSIQFIAANQGRFPLYRVPLERGDLQTLTWQANWGVRDYDMADDVLVQVITAPGNPYELYAGTRDGKIAKPITRHNSEWLKQRRLAAYEEFHVESPRGRKVQSWIIKPPDFDPTKKYPLLLQIHGGPAAMWGPGEASMWHEFQFYAARGYVVVFCNPRGSDGYGRDFKSANYQDWGAGPTADVLAAADQVAREPWIDRDRQVVTGGSYAGYLTAWIVAHDHRFRAAVAQRGVYDLATFFGEGTAWQLVPRYFGGLPWEPETRRILDRESPITHVAHIRTPLLIQHGDVDFRTGVIQSQMLYKALKVLDRPVEYVRYPRASHEMSRSGEPRHRLDSLVRYEEFFRRHIGGE